MKRILWGVLACSVTLSSTASAQSEKSVAQSTQFPPGKATLAGRVLYENGRPASGVPVVALMQQSARWSLYQKTGLAYGRFDEEPYRSRWSRVERLTQAQTTTRHDGTFQFTGLTSAPYNLVIAKTNDMSVQPFTDWVAPAQAGVWAKEGELRRAAPLMLTHGSLIRGQVVDKVSGAPLSGVDIAYNGPHFPKSADNAMFTKSDANGRFVLRVPPGETTLATCGPADSNDGSQPLTYAGTKEVSHAYVLRTARGLYAGGHTTLFATLDGAAQKWDGYELAVTTKAGQDRNLVLRLRRLVREKPVKMAMPKGAGVLTGKVVYPDGTPAMNLPVSAVMDADYIQKLRVGMLGSYMGRYPDAFQKIISSNTITGEDGTYRLENVTDAPYLVIVGSQWRHLLDQAKPDDLSGWLAPARRLTAKEGQSTNVPDLVLTHGALLQGRVLDMQSNAPLFGVQLAIYDAARPPHSERACIRATDSEGRFSIQVAPGTCYAVVAGPGREVDSHQLQLTTKERDFFKKREVPWPPFVVKIGETNYAGYDWVTATAEDEMTKLQMRAPWVQIQVTDGQTQHFSLRLKPLLLDPKAKPMGQLFSLNAPLQTQIPARPEMNPKDR